MQVKREDRGVYNPQSDINAQATVNPRSNAESVVGVGVVLVDEEKQTTMSRVRWDNEEKRHNNQRHNSMALHLIDVRGADVFQVLVRLSR